MRSDLVGRVRNTTLGARSGLMPLFEAVVNGVHAIQDRQHREGEIEVTIKRGPSGLFGSDATGSALADIQAFTIRDDGVGFTQENFASFETMDSRAKAQRGGKGIGRLLWLVAFEHADVLSEFCEDGRWQRRTFEFYAHEPGIINPRLLLLDAPADHRTEVRLLGFREKYRAATVKSAEAIGRQLVEHCLEYFLLGQMPRLFLTDPAYSERLALHEMYAAEYRPTTAPRPFTVRGQPFTIQDVHTRGGGDAGHALKFCAHNRAVDATGLTSRLPYLQMPLKNERGEVGTYQGYVTGPLLDERVDPARTGFAIDRREELPFAEGTDAGPNAIVWEDIVAAATSAVDEFLKPRTEDTRREAYARVERFIETQPQYRVLIGHKRAALEAIPGNLSTQELDSALHRLHAELRQEVRADAGRRLEEVKGALSLGEHRDAVVRVLGNLSEVAKSDLAQYVVDRATVLSFYQSLLGTQDDGSFAREDALHSLFFPMRCTSNEVEFREHNLWLLDERLAYHQYLASDLKFSKQNKAGAPAAVESEDRPDLLIYNRPHAYTPGDAPFGSVVIVEFKRPDRSDYQPKDSPIRQVLRYVQLVREGKAQREDGSTLEPLPNDLPFYCYIVATLTPELREEAQLAGFIEAPDRCGYFHYNPNYRAYIELNSYRKVLDDARKRNQAFFDRLQIRVPTT